MGNQQTNRQANLGDNDSTEVTETKCEIPKNKVKDSKGKSSRSDKSYNAPFYSKETYPLENRTQTEHQLNESAELDPFEIIEDEDIQFIDCVGTSDVIKSASNSKFKIIPEERVIQESEIVRDIDKTDHTCPLIIDNGDISLESTCEFNQVKATDKTNKFVNTNIEEDHVNKTVSSKETKIVENNEIYHAAVSSPSSYSSKEESSCSSNEKSIKPMQKQLRKLKAIKNETIGAKQTNEKDTKRNVLKLDSTALQDTNIDSVLLHPHSMFTHTELDDQKAGMSVEDSKLTIYPATHESMDLSAKLEQTGITVGQITLTQISSMHEEDEAPKRQMNTATTELKFTIETFNNVSAIKNVTDSNISDQSSDAAVKNVSDCLNSTKVSETKKVKLIDNALKEKKLLPIHEIKYFISEDAPIDDINNETLYDKIAIDTLKDEDDNVFIAPLSPVPVGLDSFRQKAEEECNEDVKVLEKKECSEIVKFSETVSKSMSPMLKDDDNNNTDVNAAKVDVSMCRFENHVEETLGKGIAQSHVLPNQSQQYVDKNDDCDVITIHVITNNRVNDKFTRSRSDSSSTLKRISFDADVRNGAETISDSSDDNLPDYFNPRETTESEKFGIISLGNEDVVKVDSSVVFNLENNMNVDGDEITDRRFTGKVTPSLHLLSFECCMTRDTSKTDEIADITPTAEVQSNRSPLVELAKAEEETLVQYEPSKRRSVTCTESDLDISEHRDDLSTDSMLADDEDEETVEILFTKTYTEPVDGAEVFLSCTVVNSAYKNEKKKSETWLSDEALEYIEASSSEVMSTAFLKAKKEMKDIQICLQSLRKQMEHFRGDYDDISLPDIPVDSFSPDYFGFPRKAITD